LGHKERRVAFKGLHFTACNLETCERTWKQYDSWLLSCHLRSMENKRVAHSITWAERLVRSGFESRRVQEGAVTGARSYPLRHTDIVAHCRGGVWFPGHWPNLVRDTEALQIRSL
jgi:hypothetical protein